MKKETVKIMKMSRYSYGVVVPKEFIRELKWKEKQKIDVILKGEKLEIKDWKNTKNNETKTNKKC